MPVLENVLNRQREKQTSHKLIERLLAEHDFALRRFIRVRMNSSVDCDDVMQEVYMRLSQIEDLPAKLAGRLDTARNYLIQIASNLLIDRARRAQVRCADQHQGEYALNDLIAIDEPDRQLHNKRLLHQVECALQQIRQEQRQAFLMHRIDGLSYREISDNLGVSVSTVEKHISAALLVIRNSVDTAALGSNQHG
ncbi:RNA polymerase sigma factor [Alishewanella sp. SMS8]|uniref:RNA polymerase sigma factor n=1 Tax=unclassified Alishewanella TaxID=2628974 RepID=UPI002742062A|nr:RNA polymerase sigma factor [Alishewanella sp. SMS8]MDP4944643.1 RNA polymerase sigma factor [Alishewanella sp.]MDP5036115.1 RNA polymerase sigma factor [Alishewanella sp.]MDP5207974.1 RNA polymerase sigma factor [Alishewanella sp. SMS9]MDP5460070.1 RNA polymerase sigma factor [Alishewanella sp. SMS8]